MCSRTYKYVKQSAGDTETHFAGMEKLKQFPKSCHVLTTKSVEWRVLVVVCWCHWNDSAPSTQNTPSNAICVRHACLFVTLFRILRENALDFVTDNWKLCRIEITHYIRNEKWNITVKFSHVCGTLLWQCSMHSTAADDEKIHTVAQDRGTQPPNALGKTWMVFHPFRCQCPTLIQNEKKREKK